MLWGLVLLGRALSGGGLPGWAAGLALAGAMALAWGLRAAPKARHRLRGAGLLLFKALAFALGALAWALVSGMPAGLAYAALAAGQLGLALALRQL